MRAMVWMKPASSCTSSGGTGMCSDGRLTITTMGPITNICQPKQCNMTTSCIMVSFTSRAQTLHNLSFYHITIICESVSTAYERSSLHHRQCITLKRQPPCSTYCCSMAGKAKPRGPSPDTSCSTPSTCNQARIHPVRPRPHACTEDSNIWKP